MLQWSVHFNHSPPAGHICRTWKMLLTTYTTKTTDTENWQMCPSQTARSRMDQSKLGRTKSWCVCVHRGCVLWFVALHWLSYCAIFSKVWSWHRFVSVSFSFTLLAGWSWWRGCDGQFTPKTFFYRTITACSVPWPTVYHTITCLISVCSLTTRHNFLQWSRDILYIHPRSQSIRFFNHQRPAHADGRREART